MTQKATAYGYATANLFIDYLPAAALKVRTPMGCYICIDRTAYSRFTTIYYAN
jgi:polyferredoxin